MSAELVLAAVAAGDLCIQYGRRVREVYHLWKGAEGNIKDKVLVLEAILSRTAVQLEFLKRVAGSMGEEHCRVHLQVLETLKGHLRMAAVKIESVIKTDSKSGIKPVKYLFLHHEIEDSMAQLEQWQRVFDPTWYLILRIGDKLIDAELAKPLALPEEADALSLSGTTAASVDILAPAKKLRSSLTGGPGAESHIYLPEDGLDWQRATAIAYSNTRLIPRVSKGQRLFAVDTIDCTTGLDLSQTRADAEALAKTLGQIDPGTFGLLSCYGLVKQKQPESRQIASISLIFRMPTSEREPASLRDKLLHGPRDSLSRTLATARQLARAVSFVHTCDFVHKKIRPETILLFLDDTGAPPRALGSTYLVGFDSFRNVRYQTLRRGDAAWERNLYRHPSRQGIFAQEEYIMQHDVYSLGVCLLELGLWESFVSYENDDDGERGSGDQVALPSKSLGLSPGDFEFTESAGMQPSSGIKDHLVDLAKTRLPMQMGDKYTAVVIACLTCLDKDNEEFGSEDDMRDDDGILIGVRFIEKVLLKLSSISI
ncbi:het-s domain-containingprotein [Purpureocillium lavendulum]|uniref:Het-s domain-containingprotein n=1 Tax=Purpureocillium lavendulum TaxID=1247861 RepID=A0AB34FNW6_9HYPO|nr:het-s domain-containingprotein [Purpureocillium lavendulum]